MCTAPWAIVDAGLLWKQKAFTQQTIPTVKSKHTLDLFVTSTRCDITITLNNMQNWIYIQTLIVMDTIINLIWTSHMTLSTNTQTSLQTSFIALNQYRLCRFDINSKQNKNKFDIWYFKQWTTWFQSQLWITIWSIHTQTRKRI